jgi:hypothetical protein
MLRICAELTLEAAAQPTACSARTSTRKKRLCAKKQNPVATANMLKP